MNFKKMMSILCALVLCVSAMLPVALAEEAAQKTATMYVSNSEGVNLRDWPNTSEASKVLALLAKDTAVEVLSSANGWSKVRANGMEGFV